MFDKLLFFSVFFSFAFLFRIEIADHSIYFYQICIIFLDFFIFIYITRKDRLFLNLHTTQIIIIIFGIIFFGLISFFGIRYNNNYGYLQYKLGTINLLLNYLTVILLLVASNLLNIKISVIRYVLISLKIIICYGVLQVICFLLGIDINRKIIDLLNLSTNGSLNLMGQFFRVSSLTWDTNYFGFYCLIYQCLYVILEDYKNKKNDIFLFLSVCLMILTFSRTSYLGFVFVIILHFISDKVKISKITLYFITFFSFALVIAYIYKDIFLPIIVARFGFLVDSKYTTGSNTYRLEVLKIGYNIIINNPFFGIGLNNFSNAMLHLVGNSFYKLHNSFVQIAVEQGLISLCLFVSFIKKCIFVNKKSQSEKLLFFCMLLVTNLLYDFLLSFFGFFILLAVYFKFSYKELDFRGCSCFSK